MHTARRAAAFLALAVSTSAFAQQPPKVSETIDVSIRNVDIIVTDVKGARIPNLQMNEFALFEDGVAHPITNFSEVRVDGAAVTGQPSPRRILLLFDIASLPQSSRRYAVESTKKFIADNLRPTDRFAIYAAGNSLTKLIDWTSDRASLEKALDDVSVSGAAQMGGSREEGEARIRQQIIDAQVADAASFATGHTFETLVHEARSHAQMKMRDSVATVNMLTSALGFFGSASAKRAVVLVGGGLATSPGADLFQMLEALRQDAERGGLGPSIGRKSSTSSPLAESNTFDLTPYLRDTAARARARGISIYSLDPELGEKGSAHVERTTFSNSDADFAGVATRAAGYQYLANQTAGLAILGRHDTDALTDVAKDLNSYYSIAYRTDAKGVDAPRIEVKSKSGYRVRAALAPLPPTRDALVSDRVIANHLEAPPTNDMGIAVKTDTPVVDGTRRRVKLTIMIPVKSLTLSKEGEFVTGGFNVYVATGDATGGSSEVNRQQHEIKWPAAALEQLREKAIGYGVEVVLEPGRKQISVGVADQKSDATGFGRVDV